MAPLARRPCIYTEDGCNWQTPQCDQITTVAEAQENLKLHSTECIFNPRVVEERRYWRQVEADKIDRRETANLRREAAEAEERREQRDYQRQQEVARVAAETAAINQREPPIAQPARPMAPKPAPMPRAAMERQMSQQEWRQFSERWGRYKAVALEPWNYSGAQTANELWA